MSGALPPGMDLCKIPAMMPPPGVIPNFEDPTTLAPTIIGVSSVLTAIATVFTIGRIINNYQVRNIRIADYIIVLGWMGSVGYWISIMGLTRFHRHQWDVPACWYNGDFMKWVFVQGMFVPLGIMFSKIAILLLYLQVFTVERKMRIAIWVGIVATSLIYGYSLIVVPYFAAPHIGETWDDLLINKRPWKLTPTGAEQGSLAVLIDLYILILPFPVLSTLKLKKRRRLKLFFVFGTASLGVLASVLALVFKVKLIIDEDGTWAQAQTYICVIVENYIAVIVACMPAFAHFCEVHIGESQVFKSISSKIFVSQKTGSEGSALQKVSVDPSWKAGSSHSGASSGWKMGFIKMNGSKDGSSSHHGDSMA
ncbi:hypothetical protein V8F06_011152 [Rhypophila decipiens]